MSDVVVDACCMLNLIASGHYFSKDEPSSNQPHQLSVPDVVVAELLFVYQPDPDDSEKLLKAPAGVQELIDEGVLSSCSLHSGDESDLFVRLAVRLDDGEAACLAIAKHRSLTLATDDRVARRISNELSVDVLGTPELVRSWAEHCDVSPAILAESISNIQRLAKFVPRPGTTYADWWFKNSE